MDKKPELNDAETWKEVGMLMFLMFSYLAHYPLLQWEVDVHIISPTFALLLWVLSPVTFWLQAIIFILIGGYQLFEAVGGIVFR